METLHVDRACKAAAEISRFPLLLFSVVMGAEGMMAMQGLWASAEFGRSERCQLCMEAVTAPPEMHEALGKTIEEDEEPTPLVEGARVGGQRGAEAGQC